MALPRLVDHRMRNYLALHVFAGEVDLDRNSSARVPQQWNVAPAVPTMSKNDALCGFPTRRDMPVTARIYSLHHPRGVPAWR
jgi:hypothetical protein